MGEQPKAPKSELDWCLDRLIGTLSSELPATLYGKIQVRIDTARAELEELRAKAEQVDLCQRAVDALIERKYEDVEAWADQLAKDVCNATD